MSSQITLIVYNSSSFQILIIFYVQEILDKNLYNNRVNIKQQYYFLTHVEVNIIHQNSVSFKIKIKIINLVFTEKKNIFWKHNVGLDFFY